MSKITRDKTPKVFHLKPALSAISILLSAFAISCAQSPSQGTQDDGANVITEPLFTDAGDAVQAMSINRDSDDDSFSLKRRFVKVNLNVLKTRLKVLPYGEDIPLFLKLDLNLFDGETVRVLLEEATKYSDDNVVITGQIVGDNQSSVSLVYNDETFIANIRQSNSTEFYEVRYLDSGIHTVDLKMEDPDHSCIEVENSEPSANGDGIQALPEEGEDEYFAQGLPVIDILAAYTPRARSRQGGTSAIKALIQLGIADTNRAMRDSGVNLQVRLVGTMEVKKNETNNWSRDLSRLKGKSDGQWDEVHAQRSRLGADQVTLVGAYTGAGSTAGIGYIRASASSAFTIVRTSAFSQYTFTHELGHNLGLNHSDGYVNSSGRFRTIMAYGSYPRVRRFSNPAKSYNGYRTGTSAKNSYRIINSRAYTVASLYAAKPYAADVDTNTQNKE